MACAKMTIKEANIAITESACAITLRLYNNKNPIV
jgi:hypothetical protein